MLTVILLVVLAGGAGLLAVSSVDPGSLRRFAGRAGARSLRAADDGDTAPAEQRAAVEPEEPAPAPFEVASAGGPAPRFAPIEVPVVPGPVRRRRRGSVPVAFTAVEGAYRDVAVSPLWRRMLSLVLLLVVLFGTGVALAGLSAALLGAAAELVNRAIG